MGGKSQIVNLDYLNSMSGGNPDIIREMIEMFNQQIPGFIQEMNDLYNRQDWIKLGALAHKAKSSIAIMGMDELTGKMKELEMKARNSEDTDTYKHYITLFEDQTNQAVEELKEIIKTL
ncbi:MAG: Hpt domain-containing protein [Chlorobi bacterium]|nr:Hpt domain-containing protein [Chlorobiota bacterium]